MQHNAFGPIWICRFNAGQHGRKYTPGPAQVYDHASLFNSLLFSFGLWQQRMLLETSVAIHKPLHRAVILTQNSNFVYFSPLTHSERLQLTKSTGCVLLLLVNIKPELHGTINALALCTMPVSALCTATEKTSNPLTLIWVCRQSWAGGCNVFRLANRITIM